MPAPDRAAGADPAHTVELLWGTAPTPKRGPRPGLDRDAITAAAIALADEQGFEALSMRKLAAALGVGAMSLYTYVPGKAELLALVVDALALEVLDAERAAAAAPSSAGGSRDWQADVRRIAQENWAGYLRHPWVLAVEPDRPVLGPHMIAKYDHELAALDGIGLTDLEMDRALALVHSHVKSAARGMTDAALAERRTGITEQEWWDAAAPALERVFDPVAHPLATRIGQAAGEANQSAFEPDHGLAFGLERILDGIATLVATRPA